MMVRITFLLGLTVVALVANGRADAQQPLAVDLLANEADARAQAAIQTALAKKVDLNFTETRLDQVASTQAGRLKSSYFQTKGEFMRSSLPTQELTSHYTTRATTT